MTVHAIVNFTVLEEKLESFKTLLTGIKLQLPTVDGCLNVQIFNDINNPLNFTLIEEWQTKEQHEAHIANIKALGAWDLVCSHLSADPVSSHYNAV